LQTSQVADLLGINSRTIQNRVAPDAWISTSGELYPIWLASTIEHHAQPGGVLDKTKIKRGHPHRGREPRPVPGPERVVVQRRPVEVAAEVEVAS
jgi:hypothetical protein